MRHRDNQYTFIELDIKKDLIFINAENVLDKKTLKEYEDKIENNVSIKPINIFKTKNRKTLLKELEVTKLIPLIREAQMNEWIYVVTDGCHRATAFTNKKKKIPAYLIWIDE